VRRSNSLGLATLLAISSLFAACKTLPTAAPTTDWPTAKSARQALAHWEMTGKAAVATENQGWSANLTWNQQEQISELNLHGALGVGGVHVRSDGQSVQIDTSKGERIEDADAAAALERTIGVPLPLPSLRYWLLGVPAPGTDAEEELDPQGRLASLKQDGWSMAYDQYAYQNGAWLPGRVRLENGPVRVKVVVDHWSL
jgi:outer membrane lipoprotein LolB